MSWRSCCLSLDGCPTKLFFGKIDTREKNAIQPEWMNTTAWECLTHSSDSDNGDCLRHRPP